MDDCCSSPGPTNDYDGCSNAPDLRFASIYKSTPVRPITNPQWVIIDGQWFLADPPGSAEAARVLGKVAFLANL